MKQQFYTFFLLLLGLAALLVPGTVHAQCNCSNGDPSTPVLYRYEMPVNNNPINYITFPQFDPSIGTLVCVRLTDTLSGITTTYAENLASSDVVYRFLLSISNNITAPGISHGDSYTAIYGDLTLRHRDSTNSDTTFGPTMFFDRVGETTTRTSGLGAYLGSGNVTIEYQLSGGLISQKGGLNYNSAITTNVWGVFELTYFWCPSVTLNNQAGILNFTAARSGTNLQIGWIGYQHQPGAEYILEMNDGRGFQPIRKYGVNQPATVNYQLQLPSSEIKSAQVQFRVKRVDPNGQVIYSAIRNVLLGNAGNLSLSVYPNPVKGKSLQLEFDRVLKGRYDIEIINTAGQRVYNGKYELKNQHQLPIELPAIPLQGLYYLRFINQETREVMTTRLMIQ